MREFYKLSIREKKYFCITIPVEYIRENNLNAGDSLYFYIRDNCLLVLDRKWDNSHYKFVGEYKLSKRGKRGWVATVPLEWINLVSGKEKDILEYSYDRDCVNCIVIERKKDE